MAVIIAIGWGAPGRDSARVIASRAEERIEMSLDAAGMSARATLHYRIMGRRGMGESISLCSLKGR